MNRRQFLAALAAAPIVAKAVPVVSAKALPWAEVWVAPAGTPFPMVGSPVTAPWVLHGPESEL